MAYEDYDLKYQQVRELKEYLIDKIKDFDITINSNDYCLPHMVNISLHGIKSEVMLHALEEKEIFISTQTACSVGNYSKAVFAITHDKDLASSSLRISLSYLTTKEELDIFVDALKDAISKLSFRREV